MIHSPACEAFRDRRIRDPETAQPERGSSEREHNVAGVSSHQVVSYAAAIPGQEFLALMQMRVVVVHFVVHGAVVVSLDYLRLSLSLPGTHLLNTSRRVGSAVVLTKLLPSARSIAAEINL